MNRLSSNLTLFLKIFLPTAWASFFGLFGIVIFILDPMDEPFLTSTYFRAGYVIFFLLFAFLVFMTIGRLKRVETSEGHLYVTNYFKTVRFPVENVADISTLRLWKFEFVKFKLLKKGIFGSSIRFLAKRSNYHHFLSQYPQLKK